VELVSTELLIKKVIQSVDKKSSRRDSSFWVNFTHTINTILEKDQKNKLEKNTKRIDCKSGCWNCCCHWVEDVYFYEGITKYSYLKEHYSTQLETILSDAEAGERIFQELYEQNLDISEIELLQKFYRLQQPCPLLNSNGECIVYDVRPLTCRSFFSKSRKQYCEDDSSSSNSGTYMITPSEIVQNLLDDLHLMYTKTESTSLRSLLVEIDKNE